MKLVPSDPTTEQTSEPAQSELRPASITVPASSTNAKPIECRLYKSTSLLSAYPGIIATHGASGTNLTSSLVHLATGLATSFHTQTFQGPMNLLTRTKQFHAVLSHYLDQNPAPRSKERAEVIFAGRSMGARAAVLASTSLPDAVAEQVTARKVVLASYPLISPKGDSRADILLALPSDTLVLFITGDRDSMCPLPALQKARKEMKAPSWLLVAKGADHGMGLSPKAAVSAVGEMAGKAAVEWVRDRDAEKTEGRLWWDGGKVKVEWGKGEGGREGKDLESMGFKRKRKDGD